MGTFSWGDLLSFGLGLGTALLGVAAKYVMDYRLARRRLEMDERAAITSALGKGACSPGSASLPGGSA
jgi:hypothetical protein